MKSYLCVHSLGPDLLVSDVFLVDDYLNLRQRLVTHSVIDGHGRKYPVAVDFLLILVLPTTVVWVLKTEADLGISHSLEVIPN